MKIIKGKVKIFTVTLILIIILSCERVWDNPWDDKASILPADWAPYELIIVNSNSFNAVTLKWKEKDSRHEGYKVERSNVGDQRWILVAANITSSGNDPVTFTDYGVDLQRWAYSYRVYATVKNRSSDYSNEVLIRLPKVNTLRLEQLPSGVLEMQGEVERAGSSNTIFQGFILAEQNNNPLVSHGVRVAASTLSGKFNAQLPSNLVKGRTYYFRAYAETEVGVGYGEVFSVEGY